MAIRCGDRYGVTWRARCAGVWAAHAAIDRCISPVKIYEFSLDMECRPVGFTAREYWYCTF